MEMDVHDIKILLVDDKSENSRLLSDILISQGYKVQRAISGKLAVDAALAAPPDLILLEIIMPDMNGYEVSQQLKAHPKTREIPIIFLSVIDEISEKVTALKLGDIDYITKPLQAEEILVRVENQITIIRLSKQLKEQNAQLQNEIQERKQAQAALKASQEAHRQSEERLNLALEASNLGLWDWNLKSGQIYRDWRWTRILGYAEHEIADNRLAFEQLVHPEDLPAINQSLNEHLQGTNPVYEMEFRMRSKSGEWKWILSRGQVVERDHRFTPLRVTGTHTDITERKTLERELALREARFNAFFSSAPVCMSIVDNQLRYAQTNELLAEVTGIPVQDLIGKTIYEVMPNIAPLLEPIYQQVLSTGQAMINQELSVSFQSGIVRHLLVSFFPISGENGQPSGVGTVAAEISDRKRAEKELRLANERLQHLLSHSPAIIFSCKASGEHGTTFLSENVAAILGYERREFQENPNFWASHIHPEDVARVLAIIPQLFEDGYYSQEYRFLHADGTYHWLYDQVKLVRDEAGNPIELVGHATDITERKQAELALQESQRRYQTLAEASPACIFHDDPDGYRVYINQRWTQITGLSVEEALGTKWHNIIHPDDRERVLATWSQAATARIPYKCEHRLVGELGRIIWVICQALPEFGENGEIKGYIGIVTDITERKLAEVAIRESAERERAITQVIQRMRQTLDIESIFAATTQELRQTLSCDRVVVYHFKADWSGEFVAESVGKGWISLIEEFKNDPNLTNDALGDERCIVQTLDSQDNQVVDTYLQETQGGVYNRGTSFLCVPDIHQAGFDPCYVNLLERFQAKAYITVPIFCGSQLWGLLASYQNSGPRQWKTGEINIAVQIGNQLGVALQQAELLAQTQQQSKALQKAVIAADAANRAKSEFLSNMSHELRNPLNAILGFTQLMSRDRTLLPQHQQHLEIINRAGEHLLNLINDILEMSKIEAGRTTLDVSSVDLIRLLDNLKEMLHLPATSKGLQLVFEYDPGIPQYIQTDASKLRQVLLNLLGNAIKFTDSGSVMLRVSTGYGEMTSRHNPTTPVSHLFFEVQDTGAGIAQEEIEQLFEPFKQSETGRKSQQGTGLGLAICRKYVELMGGEISVCSTVGVGSTFAFDIEITSANKNELPRNPVPRQIIRLAPNQPEYRILVVDDAIESRILLVKLLTAIGFSVREAANGTQAISQWESWHPHLILMDMRMPIMDGYEATRQIKARQSSRWGNKENVESNSPHHPTTPPPHHQFPTSQTVIIALTASAFEEQKMLMVEAGCDDFINKPFREELLLKKLSQYLGVKYLYEERNYREDERKKTLKPLLISRDLLLQLSQMSSEWVTQLNHAAAQCSDDLILNLLQQIPPEYAQLKSALKDLAQNFQFEKIMELVSIVQK